MRFEWIRRPAAVENDGVCRVAKALLPNFESDVDTTESSIGSFELKSLPNFILQVVQITYCYR